MTNRPDSKEASTTVILKTEHLNKAFGGLRAVNDVNLTVRAGRLHAIIGPNGSGKSTLFNLICGRFPPTAGTIHFHDRAITGLKQHQIARLGIAKSYQITTIFKDLTVHENLRVAAQARRSQLNFWRRAASLHEVNDQADEVLEIINLKPKRYARASQLSHGEQRHLDIGIALAARPELLLLDEPTAGMSPFETSATMQLIRDILQRVTVVLIEHKMDMILQISDWITVLNLGEVLAEGTPAEVQANQRVQDVYLAGVV